MSDVRIRLSVLSILLFTFFFTAALAAAQVVENGAKPAQGLVTVGMTEQWRAGGEDDDVFFGTVGAVRTDGQGRIYLLDSQLAEVHIYSPEGEHLGTAGREGDGPGESRRPNDMFITDDGIINILQGFPGRIVKITADGTPAGEATFSAGPDAAGQFGVLVVGRSDGNDMVLSGIRMTIGGAISQQTYFLSRCDAQGMQKSALLEKQHEINYADFKLDEMSMDFVWNRMDVGPDGKVYAGPERNNYLINVYGADGGIEKTITRQYTSPPRTGDEKKLARQIIEAVGANYPVQPREITIEETEAVFRSLAVTQDGRIWVQTSAGNKNCPEGTWVVLDVFDPSGKFEKQVALQGMHDPSRDSVLVMPDGRVVVIVGALDAWLNQQGAAGSDEVAVESDPLEVICYQLDW
jgi:hypothetical protein